MRVSEIVKAVYMKRAGLLWITTIVLLPVKKEVFMKCEFTQRNEQCIKERCPFYK